MFRRAGTSLTPHLRRLHQQASTSTRTAARHGLAFPGIALSGGALVAYTLWSNTHIHNDAVTSVGAIKAMKPDVTLSPGGDVGESEELRTVVWGSNRSNILIPAEVDLIRSPSVAEWLDGVALRDLVFHQDHAACVDARGDVYQWGSKFSGEQGDKKQKPTLTLREKNIKQLRLTEGRVFALSSSGKVYALSAESAKQELRPGEPTPSSDGWWGTGWFWGEDETVDFVEITPSEQLGWGEKFVAIDSGNDHLLALTSKGRLFAHPINKKANAHGQLGFRKFQIPDPSALHRPNIKHHLMDVELIPKAVADPYVYSSRNGRLSPVATTSENLTNIEDDNIRFCTHLFEIPVLKGIEIAQMATGARSSFARTPGGRILSWGANDHGQLGLGSNMVLDTVTVPTEVVLWRAPATRDVTNCSGMSAGGDLTAFTVEDLRDPSVTTVDVLMCGNGQWGGLGTTVPSTAQTTPSPAKGVSGLVEYNDAKKGLQPITPHSIAVSPTGHVLLTLNTASTTKFGRDLVVWGRNYEYELGNGKRANVAMPTTLETPSGRFMLRERKADVKDLHGKLWKRNVLVEQQPVVGFGNSCVYWKVV